MWKDTYEGILREVEKACVSLYGERLVSLAVLAEEGAHSDVVREAQELVELALKAMLRFVGVDPPKWHDVGPILLEHGSLFPESLRAQLPAVAEISRWLRRERELAFHGDVDFVPTEEYSSEEADRAIADARHVLEVAAALIPPP